MSSFSEFTVETQSTVRIKLNGLTFRTVSLSPGNYRLLDLPFTYGLNNFILEIEGRQRRHHATEGRHPSRDESPRRGIFRIFGSRRAWDGTKSPNPSVPPTTAAACLRDFTAGLMGQADYRSALAGTSFIFASKIGNFTGSAAAVAAWDERAHPLTGAGSPAISLRPARQRLYSLFRAFGRILLGRFSPRPFLWSTFTEMEQTLRAGRARSAEN